jgi:hypothetical protein
MMASLKIFYPILEFRAVQKCQQYYPAPAAGASAPLGRSRPFGQFPHLLQPENRQMQPIFFNTLDQAWTLKAQQAE